MPPAALWARPPRRPSPHPRPPPPPRLFLRLISHHHLCPRLPFGQSPLKCLLEFRAVARVVFSFFPLLAGAPCFWKTMHVAPPSRDHLLHLHSIFFSYSNDFLLEKWDEQKSQKMSRKEKSENSRKRALNKRMPTPSSCRVPARFRCTGPISSLRSIYLRVCRIWPRRRTFLRWPFSPAPHSGGSIIFLERKRRCIFFFFFLAAAQIQHGETTPNRDIKANKEERARVHAGLSAAYFSWFLLQQWEMQSKRSSPGFGSWQSPWRPHIVVQKRHFGNRRSPKRKKNLMGVTWHTVPPSSKMSATSKIKF